MPARPATVLAVEDDPIVRTDIRLILEDAGYACAEAADGVEAVERARRHRPDLVLIDLRLPRLDGIEATRRILRDRHVPVVALTGHGPELVSRARAVGAVAHVGKPFHARQLLDTVATTLERHGRVAGEPLDVARARVAIELLLARGATGREVERMLRRDFPALAGRRALASLRSRAGRLLAR